MHILVFIRAYFFILVVEAGEGHGPRKEMFRLACDEVIQNTARHVGTGCLVGKKDSEIIKLTVPVSSMLVSIRPGHRLEFPYNPASASTETIKSESKADVIAETVVVASIIDDYTLRLDTPLQRTYTDEYQQHNSRCKEGTHMEKAHPPVHYLHIVDVSPLLVYQRASETFFVDPGILSTAENIYRYRYLGKCMYVESSGKCVYCVCHLYMHVY